MSRPPNKTEEKGVYRKDGKPGLWLRYSHEGRQVRVPLHTRDFAEAVQIAKTLRGQPPKVREGEPGFGWKKTLERYLAVKQAPERPPGSKGQTRRTFRPATVPKVRSCLQWFATWTGTKHPTAVSGL